MASRTKIASKLARRLSGGFVAHKDAVYIPGFEYFAHGILIEGTPYKDTVYVWHLIGNFLYPRSFLLLSYSSRIPSSDEPRKIPFEGTDPEIIEKTMQRLAETGLLETLADEYTLADYLAGVRGPAGDDPLFGRGNGSPENAIAYFLAGDYDRSAEHVEWCRKWVRDIDLYDGPLKRAGHLEFRDELRTKILPLFEGSRQDIARRLRAMVHQNATDLGFVPKTDADEATS